jgi:8-oxo-dGTP pyrophosphatase MutT (NUDIX family)
MNNLKIIKCRAVIVCNDKLLVVKHVHDADFYALPGGHINDDENPKECTEREIFEEFGIKPIIGKLLYISQYKGHYNENFMEFFFEVKNSVDFLDIKKFNGTHKHELVDILWISKNDEIKVLPQKMFEDFKNGVILNNEIKYIKK